MSTVEPSKPEEVRSGGPDAPTGVDPAELQKFRAIAATWWDASGPLRPLHRLNPCRLGWIRDLACRHFARDPRSLQPLAGLRVLDVGCGGGLLAEPLARMGAHVTAIDPEAENIAVASEHARAQEVTIDYRVATTYEVAASGARFDLVLALEVVEHTPDPAAFIRSLATTSGPRGLVILSTLSRTWRSWLLGIVGAEYLLRWLPPGTHDWQRFRTPAEMTRLMRDAGLRAVAGIGIAYDPAQASFRTSRDMSVNYMVAGLAD